MNEDTRVIICCYEGDMHQLNLGAYLQHGCPVTVLSPDDSRAVIDHPGIDCKFGGKRAYTGQDSLDRQHEHLKLMLTYPENFFLIHDSDSVLLDAKIPDYLYAEPDVVWSNQVDDGIPEHQATFPEGWPHIALQPPYFLSRKSIEAMVVVGDDPRVKATPVMPFIDYYMVQLTVVAGLPYKRFADCLSCPITCDPRQRDNCNAGQIETYKSGYQIAMNAVLHGGATVLHSVKDPSAVEEFLQARRQFLVGNPNPVPRMSPPPTVGGRRRGRVIYGGPGLKA
jgi:hypothetical protein